MKFVLIRPGRLRMGSPRGEAGRQADEGPVEVELTRPLYVAVFEVTQEEFVAVMGYNPSHFKVSDQDQARFPVESVTWTEAGTFCTKLSNRPKEKKAGRLYRLLRESEWEYAARAGTTTPFAFGKNLGDGDACFDARYPCGGGKRGEERGRPCSVGSYLPNAWGLHDMHGNVREWCADGYRANITAPGVVRDPFVGTGRSRVLRGGSWNTPGVRCRSARRERAAEKDRMSDIGFRVALIPADAE
jgi:formylglycine-generating enzyme required for sulfatase activity